MNNIIQNKSIIECNNFDNDILKCNINNCTCNNKCKCFRVKSIVNNIHIPYSTPFTNNIPPDNDVNMVDKTSKTHQVQFADHIEPKIFNINAPTNDIQNIIPRINVINNKQSKPFKQPLKPFKSTPPRDYNIRNEPVDAINYFSVDAFNYF
eukprot:949980_1